jgi:tetratricopeptide (TPR) repeat protein
MTHRPTVSVVIALLVLISAAVAGRELWFRSCLNHAESLLVRGDPAAAERQFDQALQIKTTSVEAIVGRAAAREQSGDIAGAIAQLRTAIARQAREPRLHLELAGALLRHGAQRQVDEMRQAHDEAVNEYQQAAALRPSDARVLNDVGLGLRSIGRTDLAIPIFKQASTAARNWGGPDVNLADTYREMGRYDDALAVFRELENRAIDVPAYRIQNALGQVYLDSGRPQDAERVLRRGVALNPQYGPVRMTLTLALLEQRRYAEASTEMEQAMRFDPQPDRLFFMCQLYAIQKRADDVLRCLSLAISAGTSPEPFRKDSLFAFVRDREEFRRLTGDAQVR